MDDHERSRVVDVLADLLMGAAYSDEKLDGREVDTVREKLATWLEVDEIPEKLQERLDAFDPKSFNLDVTASLLHLDDQAQAYKVLELVAAVNEADGELDLAEDQYLQSLATVLGLAESEYADLKLEILAIEDIREELGKLKAVPPPLPTE